MADSGVAQTQAGRAFIAPPSIIRYVVTSAIYLTADFGINLVTRSHHFSNSSITLWSPDDGINLLLLTESTFYTPIIFIAAIIDDLYIQHTNYNMYSSIVSEFLLASGYFTIALVLRDVFHFDTRSTNYRNMIAVLAVVPAGSLITGAIYTLSLFITGSLASSDLYTATKNFWIGDTVGMIVVLPAATAIHDIFSNQKWRRLLKRGNLVAIALVFLCIATSILISSYNISDRYLFNMLFLPTIWVGITYGYSSVAISLLATQLMLIASMTYFDVGDSDFTIFQTLMFILATTGQLLGAVVTEKEQATLLLRKQQTEVARASAQATTGALAATMAHEISQPLSSLFTYVHSAHRMLDSGQSAASIGGALAKAEVEARRVREIIARIRDFVSTGKLELAPTDLSELARKIVSLNIDDARNRRIELTFGGLDSSPLVPVDRIAIEQALNNLVVNAIEATSGSGSPGSVVVSLEFRDEFAILRVDDDGPGVSVEIAERQFEVFETTKPQGMGLGLPLSQQIAQKHSGRLVWRARMPRGASFSIELPTHGPEKISE